MISVSSAFKTKGFVMATATNSFERTREGRVVLNEDWLSLAIGLFIFAIAIAGLSGIDFLGWAVSTSVWKDFSTALNPVSKVYASIGVSFLQADVKRFALAFTGVFVLAYACWIIGSNAHLAAVTPADLKKFGIGWSLKLTNEGGFVVALIVGLVIANFFPRVAEW